MTNRRDEPAWGELVDLARETVRRQVELTREYADLARTSLARGGRPEVPARTYLDSLRREGEHYWRELARLGLGYAADVTALGLRASSAVARDLRTAVRPDGRAWPTDEPRTTTGYPTGTTTSPATGTATGTAMGTAAGAAAGTARAPEPAGGVALHGRAGTTATATITVENRHPRARQIRLAAGSVTDEAGREVEAQVEVTPTRLTVPAGEEAVVTLELEVTEELEPGVAYRSLVEVSGGEEATVEVHVSRDPD